MANFTLGADVEYFVYNNKEICSAINILKPKDFICNRNFYYDNILAEFNCTPTRNEQDFLEEIQSCQTELSSLIKPNKLSSITGHFVKNNILNDEEAKIAGCNPDICAYSLETKIPKETYFNNEKFYFKTNLRCAGGHIHIGHELLNGNNNFIAARLLDILIGLPSVILDETEGKLLRNSIYGNPGRFRHTKYGIEYRTLSNFWTWSQKNIKFIYKMCQILINLIESKEYKKYVFINEEAIETGDFANFIKSNYDEKQVFNCILNDKKEESKELIKFFGFFNKNDY